MVDGFGDFAFLVFDEFDAGGDDFPFVFGGGLGEDGDFRLVGHFGEDLVVFAGDGEGHGGRCSLRGWH